MPALWCNERPVREGIKYCKQLPFAKPGGEFVTKILSEKCGILNRCRFVKFIDVVEIIMNLYKLQNHVYEVGAKDPDRRIFDSLVYMPQGTTYNSFFIEGETHNALIDCVDPEKIGILLDNLREGRFNRIDYVVLLHSEQDHSGSIFTILDLFPDSKVVCTAKVKELMAIHLHLTEERMIVVKENDSIDLGGMSLTFYPIPFAHWPDNTMAFLEPQNILFSSDLFGAHYTEENEVSTINDKQKKAARGYFSEIMMPFRRNIAKYAAKVDSMNPKMIAPAHGAIWLEPKQIIDLYLKWTGDEVRHFVTIPYLTMHSSTETAVLYLADFLKARGIEVQLRNLTSHPESLLVETGEMIYDLVDASAVVFAFPTVLGGPHPAIAYTAITANAMMPKTKFMGMLCSYAWATKATDVINSVTPNFKCQRFEPLVFKGLPTKEDLVRIEKYANEIADAILG